MKILVVTQFFWPENFRINDLVTELSGRGHTVTVLTGVPNVPGGYVFPEYSRDPNRFLHFSNSRIIRVPMFPRRSGKLRLILNYLSFAISASCIGLWRCRKNSFDAVFVFSPTPITVGIPALVIGKLKRAPVLIWVLDLWPESLLAMGVKNRFILRVATAIVKLVYRGSTTILGQSKSFVESIKTYCDEVNKIEYMPSWAESVFNNLESELASEIPSNRDKFTILFAGNLGEAQDIPALLVAIEALKSDEKFRWIFVGDGRKLVSFKNEIKLRGLQEHALFLGSYPVERMPSFYQHADALLVSLKDDPVFSLTIPGKIQSYLMAGIPILAMLDGEGAKLVKTAGAGLTCGAGDGIALAHAARQMARLSAEQRDKMGQAGKSLAKQEFNRAALIDRIERLIDEAIIKKNFTQSNR